MTETFTASNGVVLAVTGDGYLVGRYQPTPKHIQMTHATASSKGIAALREFFLHERDKELGRWRSKKNPNWTAAVDLGAVHFRNDDGIHSFSVDLRGRDYSRWVVELREVAKEYFAAHPEPKPWDSAEPGEVWELTYLPLGEPKKTRPFGVDSSGKFRTTQGVRIDPFPEIVDGRRIWPEVVRDA